VTFVCNNVGNFIGVVYFAWSVWQLGLSRQLEIALRWFKKTKREEETWCPVVLEGSGALSESTGGYHLGVRHYLLHTEHKWRRSAGIRFFTAKT